MAPRTKSARRRRDPNFVVLKVNAQVALGTLAANVAVKTALLNPNDVLKVISADLTYSIQTLTPGEGPIDCGLSSDAYSVTQIVEAMDASPSNRADEVALERTRRRVRLAGTFPGETADSTLNDGRKLRMRKMYWSFAADVDLACWAINRSGSTLTTGAFLEVSGEVYAV